MVRAAACGAFCALLLGWVCLAGRPAWAQAGSSVRPVEGEIFGYIQPGVTSPVGGGLGETYGYPTGLHTVAELRWSGVVRQKLDSLCGPASLATLYTEYLDLPVTEEQMARAVTAEALRRGRGRDDMQVRGYNFPELKRVAERGRLVTAVFRSKPEDLVDLRIPVITHVNIRGYGHFVVLRGVVEDRVVIADPAFGNLTYSIGQFGALWSGVMLAVGRPKALANRPDFDPRGGPMAREIDYSAFLCGRGPHLMCRAGANLPLGFPPRTFFAIQNKIGLKQVSIGGLDDFVLISVERNAIQFNPD